jgi:hypothetical protein
MMNNGKFLIILILVVFALLLAGCGGAQSEPTYTSTSAPPTLTPSPVLPTSTLTPVPPTLTPTPVPPTLTATPKSLVITDDAFRAEDCQSNTVLEIKGVDGNRMQIKVIEGSLSIRGGRMTIWCAGIKHIWIGKITFKNHTFDSSSSDPLQFLLIDGGGYKYLGGTGIVTLPDGTQVTLP